MQQNTCTDNANHPLPLLLNDRVGTRHITMIPLLVFYLHVVVASYMYAKRWQEEGKAEAFLAVGFMILIFFVGWSVSTVLLKFFVDQAGLGRFFDRDAMSLVLLTFLEVGLYLFYFKKRIETQSSSKRKTPL